MQLNSEDTATALLRAAPSLRRSSDSYVATSVFINPDLPPAAAKLAYEGRQRRRESRSRRLASASVPHTDTMGTDANVGLVCAANTNSRQMTMVDQEFMDTVSIAIAGEPPASSVSSVKVSES